MAKIRRAILSCYDKTGIVDLARMLSELGVELVCTAGTLELCRNAGVEAVSVAEFTGIEEMLDGRVKSLHPKVHAGLLGIRDSKLHAEQMQAHGYSWIDLVVVNLHPLERLMKTPGLMVDEVIDQVDIGGTAMIRSAAKNFRYVTVVVSPDRYPVIIHELRAHDGEVSFATRYRLAEEAFACTARYDAALSEYLGNTQPSEE
ncbi:MAG TPA: IMP cyclohydrolase [Candidatus Hydrogenedentes bacterium]|nr:IMP cyclohydrolase [Candidatus Hydrogenedentota bacterium]HPG66647.1 IMP cyclohydrolase [Candidatus Hydrogenedentota bacterium]